jgi:hypothetical protein
MINTEINILEYFPMSDDEIEDIKDIAKQDAINKLKSIDEDIDETSLSFSFEFICKVNIRKYK